MRKHDGRGDSTLGETGADDTLTDHASLVGRRVLKYFANPGAWFGGVVTAHHPPVGRQQGLFHVRYEDGDAEDLTLEELLDIIRPPDTHPTHLLGTSDWTAFRKQYKLIAEALSTNSFSAHDRHFVAKALRIRKPSLVTAAKVRAKYRQYARRLHEDKVRSEPPQVRLLAKQLLAALKHIHETLDPDVENPDDAPNPRDYPAYGSTEFAAAAGCAQEDLSPPDPLTPPDEDVDPGGRPCQPGRNPS